MRTPLASLLLTLAAATPVLATNGMYMPGYGAETEGRAGANLAISDRTLGLNFNPAGIAQLQGNHSTLNLSFLAPDIELENRANRATSAKSRLFTLPAFAYVRGGKDSRITWGIGFVGQGGMGATFDGITTFLGTKDDTFSEVRFATLVPTVAYSVNDDMAFGLALNVGYADASFALYPHTSFFNAQAPEQSFFGVDLERAGGEQYNARVGWWWRPAPRFSVGAIYQTETESTFEDGDLTVDFTAHPMLGRRVGYDATIDGFTFAAQAGVGFAARPGDRVVLALDLKRYFWDSAIDTVTVTARDPDVAGAPPTITMPFVFDWKDQWIVALGGEYRWSDTVTVRAGYNYGENPVPDHTLTPLFPATVENHVGVGLGVLRGRTTYDVAIGHAFAKDQVNDNPDPMVNPFGPGTRVTHSQWTISFGISWATHRRGSNGGQP